MTDTTPHISLSDTFDAPTREAWLDLVKKTLKGTDFDKRLVSETRDGIKLQPLYPQAADASPVRAAHASAPWRVTQRVDHPYPKDANAQALADLEQGTGSLALVFPDSIAARNHGLAVETVDELDAALNGVSLEMITLRLEPAASGHRNATLAAALVEKRGVAPEQAAIAFGLDPLAVAMATGGLDKDWQTQTAGAVGFLRKQGFTGALLSCDTRPVHEAGGTPAQELAAALAMGVAYMRTLSDDGVTLAEAARHLSWTLAIDSDQFIGIAKLRALRQLWARVQEASGLTPSPIRIHAETAWRMMSRRDPAVNMLRATMATFVAATGGADSLSVLPFTLAIGLPNAFARRVARNTQNVLMEESNLWRVADPAAGAGAYEELTDALCEKAWAQFQDIEAAGGMAEHLATGKFQAAIGAARESQDKAVASRKVPITGTSEFPNLAETPETVLDVPANAHKTPSERDDVTFPPLPSLRLSAPFEALRDAADAHAKKAGNRPGVFLANLGPLAEHNTRATWIRNMLAAGGIDTINTDGFTNSTDAGKAFADSGASAACICGTDETYGQLAEATAQALQGAGATTIALAGRPGDNEAAFKTAGIGAFYFVGIDVLAALRELHGALGVKS
jgi:methylmalonyl-CoA mutase